MLMFTFNKTNVIEWLINCEHVIQFLFHTYLLIPFFRSHLNHTPFTRGCLTKESTLEQPPHMYISKI